MAATQLGTELKIAFGSFSYSGYVPESVTVSKPNLNIKTVKDANGATMTKILMDPAERINCTLIIASTGSITPPAEGSIVTLTPPAGTSTTYFCESAEVAHDEGESKLTLTLVKESSMTYTQG